MSIGTQGLIGRHGRPRVKVMEEGAWKEEGACRQALDRYVAAGMNFEHAQRYVNRLYYLPGPIRGRGRPPRVPRPREEDPYATARRWCAACPVQDDCLAEAVSENDAFGFRAGYEPAQLRVLIKARRRELRAARERERAEQERALRVVAAEP